MTVVHHLNCGTLQARGAPMVCHVLLIESPRGLVLVDTGFGTRDIADPVGRIGLARHVIRPLLDIRETAISQIKELGFSADDVRHIVLTHFDIDHVGGIADFPDATIHMTKLEADAALRHPSLAERVRYNRAPWVNSPTIVEHSPGDEKWRGLPGATRLTSIGDDFFLVPLPGHTRGHAGLLVRDGDRWLLHAGDSFYHRGTIDDVTPVPLMLKWQETLLAFDRKQLRHTQSLLRNLHAKGYQDLTIICSHDPHMLAMRRASAGSRRGS